MIHLTAADVGKKFRNAAGEVLTLTKWCKHDEQYPARLGDDQRNYNAHGRRWCNDDVKDTLVERIEEKGKPACLKTRLRTREIGRKFKTADGNVVTLTDAPSYPRGEEGWRVRGERAGLPQAYRVNADGLLLDRCDAWYRNTKDDSLHLVERLPVEKKPKPAKPAAPKFKVGDVVDFLKPNRTPWPGWTAIKVTSVDKYGYVNANNREGIPGRAGTEYCRHTTLKQKSYPDYKKMKAGLERIRDHSPIGSDAAQWAKDALEPEYVS